MDENGPVEIVDFPIKNCDLSIKNGDVPIKNGDVPIKNGDFPIKNGGSFHPFSLTFYHRYQPRLQDVVLLPLHRAKAHRQQHRGRHLGHVAEEAQIGARHAEERGLARELPGPWSSIGDWKHHKLWMFPNMGGTLKFGWFIMVYPMKMDGL